MSDSEGESRTVAVGRKRIRTGKSGEYAVAAAAASSRSSRSGSESSKESGEISNSSSDESRHGGRERHPQNNYSDHGSDAETGSSGTDSSTGTDSSDDEPPAHSMASSKGQAVSRDPKRTGKPIESKNEDRPLRLGDVSKREEDDQLWYFHQSEYDDDYATEHIVRCFCCGEKGHMRDTCSERYCKHCGAFEEHASHACPQGRKCGRCRQRGHDSAKCTNPTRLASETDDLCDICGETGHVEEECVKLWWTELGDVKMRPVRKLVKDCYNCGAHGSVNGHWGDDCPYLERDSQDSLGRQIKTWSAAHASQYEDPEVELSHSEESDVSADDPSDDGSDDGTHDEIDAVADKKRKRDDERARDESEEEGEVKKGPPAKRNWQSALFSDLRD